MSNEINKNAILEIGESSYRNSNDRVSTVTNNPKFQASRAWDKRADHDQTCSEEAV